MSILVCFKHRVLLYLSISLFLDQQELPKGGRSEVQG